ncbi:MAG: DUF6042 family protein [Stackebrandtia sp.]
MDFEDRLVQRLNDFDRTGWCRYLPWEGAFLWTMLCEATECRVDGDLDALVDRYRHVDPTPFSLGLFKGLDAVVDHRRRWRDKRGLARLFARTGSDYPQTAREVAEIGVSLGVYRCESDGDVVRWRVPAALPLPTEILEMTPRQRRAEDDRRQHLMWALPAHDIVDALHDAGCPDAVETTLGDLATLIGEDDETVRHALAHLADTRYNGRMGRALVRTYAVTWDGRRRVDPERLETDELCLVVPHWRGLAATYGVTWELLHPGETWGRE